MSINSYEIMVIFTPVLSQDEFKSETRNITDYIADKKGTIVAEDMWGLKQLAYPIDKKTTALYYVLEFQAEGEILDKFKVQLNRTESILRYMITSLDKHAIAYNDRKRKGLKHFEDKSRRMDENIPTEEIVNTENAEIE